MSNDSSNVQKDSYAAVTWGPQRAIVTAVVALLLGQIAAGVAVVGVLFATGMKQAQVESWSITTLGQFVLVVAAEALTVGLLWLLLKKRKPTWASLGFTRRPLPKDALHAVLVGVVYFVALLVAAGIAKAVFSVDVDQDQDIGFKSVVSRPELIMAFVSLVVLPPIVEEILFRGVLFGGLRKRLPFVWAVLLTSLLFAFPHALQGEGGGLLWIGAIDTFILSIALCYLREKTGSLWASIMLHMIKNGVAYLFLFVFVSQNA